jgi:hypothetical protein
MTRFSGLGCGWEGEAVSEVDMIIRLLLCLRRNVIGIQQSENNALE